MGACVLCNGIFYEYFVNFSRALIYSTALPPLNIARSLFSFLELANLNNQRANLARLSEDFKALLIKNLDLEVLGDYNIISLILGDNAKAVHFAKKIGTKRLLCARHKIPYDSKESRLFAILFKRKSAFETLESLVPILKKIDYEYLSKNK